MSDTLILKTVEILNSGGIVSFPTDTVFALACDATNDKAIKKMYEVKNRDYSKPMAIFVKNLDNLKKITKPNKFLNNFKKEILSGKLTVILEASDNTKLSKFINTKNNTIGIRIPHHKFTQQILKEFDKPIAATSVNLTGEKELIDSSAIKNEIKKKIDFIVGGKSENNCPSTIVDLTSDKPKIVRVGAIKLKEVES